MAILITGGAGFIGSHIVWLLKQNNPREDIIVVDRNPLHPMPAGVMIYEEDFVVNPQVLETIFSEHSIDVVIHLAGSISVPDSIRDPAGYQKNNVHGCEVLLAAMKKHGVMKMTFASSAAVYGNPLLIPVPEGHQLKHLSPYGKNKIDCEKAITRAGSSWGLRSVIFRFFNVAGAHPDGHTGQNNDHASSVLDVLYRCAETHNPFTINGSDWDTKDGTPLRDFIHVWDLASAHNLALSYLDNKGESFIANVGYKTGFTVLEAAEMVESVTSVDFHISFSDRASGDIGISLADNSLILEKLGWEPAHSSLEEMVETAWRWRVNN